MEDGSAFLQNGRCRCSTGPTSDTFLRWPAPVRPGDNLTLRVTVLEQRRSESRPDMGIIRWRWQLHNQDAVEVLDLEATSMFKLESPEAA